METATWKHLSLIINFLTDEFTNQCLNRQQLVFVYAVNRFYFGSVSQIKIDIKSFAIIPAKKNSSLRDHHLLQNFNFID